MATLTRPTRTRTTAISGITAQLPQKLQERLKFANPFAVAATIVVSLCRRVGEQLVHKEPSYGIGTAAKSLALSTLNSIFEPQFQRGVLRRRIGWKR